MILRWLLVLFTTCLQLVAPSPAPAPAHKPPPNNVELAFLQSGLLPKEHQVSLYLNKDETKRTVLVSERAGIPLSITLTPCSSAVAWSVFYLPHNHSITAGVNNATLLMEFKSSEMETFKTSSAQIGQYIIEMMALESGTYLQIFGSSEPEPPHAARMAQRPRMRLQRRQRRKRLTVKWDQSPIDPHVTDYCLVVSSRRNYTSLCGARGDRYGAAAEAGAASETRAATGKGKSVEGDATEGRSPGERGTRNRQQRPTRSKVAHGGNVSKMGDGTEPGSNGDILISCVGARTHHTVDNLEHGKVYYFSLFAVNKQTNLTFPYGSTVLQYDQRVKQSKLKDGKPESVNLKKLDGKAVFRYKAGKQASDTLVVSVMPCGGAVDVEVAAAGGRPVLRRRRVHSYGRLQVPSVQSGQRYVITVLAANREELRRTDAVQILATTKKKLPLPELPSQTEVREFDSLKSCDSVTVGWLPSPDSTAIRYCVVAREARRREAETRAPDQCALETRLRKSADYHLMHCRDRVAPNDKKPLMMQRISGLKPGRRYIVQVTVKKSGGKTLSYDLLTVHTKTNCK